MKVGLSLIGMALLVSATAHAQVAVDITKITCRQFLIGRVVPTSSIALWFSGYYSGKQDITVVDMAALRSNAEKIKDACRLHQDDTVMKTVQSVFARKPAF
jgi:hypothetical protein